MKHYTDEEIKNLTREERDAIVLEECKDRAKALEAYLDESIPMTYAKLLDEADVQIMNKKYELVRSFILAGVEFAKIRQGMSGVTVLLFAEFMILDDPAAFRTMIDFLNEMNRAIKVLGAISKKLDAEGSVPESTTLN